MHRPFVSTLVATEALLGRYPSEQPLRAEPVRGSEDDEPRAGALRRRSTHVHDDRPAGRMTLLPHS